MAQDPAAAHQPLWVEPTGSKGQRIPLSEYGTVSLLERWKERLLEGVTETKHQIDSRSARLQVFRQSNPPVRPHASAKYPAEVQRQLASVERRQGGIGVIGRVINQVTI